MKMIKKISFLSIIVLLSASVSSFRSGRQNIDISGKWSLDTTNIDLGGQPLYNVAVTKVQYTQRNNTLMIEKQVVDGQGLSYPSRDTLVFGHEPITRILPHMGVRKVSIKRKAIIDDKDPSVVVTTLYDIKEEDGKTWTYTATEVLKISDDGAVLVNQMTRVLPDRTEHITATYRKADDEK